MTKSPQKEDGHIDIANEIAEALMRTNISAYQYRVLWVILRKTYGWHKKFDWISNSQFVEITGLKKQHISRTIKELKERNMVTYRGDKIGFNKHYTQWRELPKKVTVTNSGAIVTNSGLKVTSTGAHKRNTTKETKQKKLNALVGFDEWYSLYPKKQAKQKAREAWVSKKNKCYDISDIVISAVQGQLDNKQFDFKEDMKYIKLPASWLNGHCWEDAFAIIKQKPHGIDGPVHM